MKNLASIMSTVLLAVTAILLVQSVLLEYYGITAKQSCNKDQHHHDLRMTSKKAQNHLTVRSSLFGANLIVAHCLCHQCHSKVKKVLKSP